MGSVKLTYHMEGYVMPLQVHVNLMTHFQWSMYVLIQEWSWLAQCQ